jgi:hypothetical protein
LVGSFNELQQKSLRNRTGNFLIRIREFCPHAKPRTGNYDLKYRRHHVGSKGQSNDQDIAGLAGGSQCLLPPKTEILRGGRSIRAIAAIKYAQLPFLNVKQFFKVAMFLT